MINSYHCQIPKSSVFLTGGSADCTSSCLFRIHDQKLPSKEAAYSKEQHGRTNGITSASKKFTVYSYCHKRKGETEFLHFMADSSDIGILSRLSIINRLEKNQEGCRSCFSRVQAVGWSLLSCFKPSVTSHFLKIAIVYSFVFLQHFGHVTMQKISNEM